METLWLMLTLKTKVLLFDLLLVLQLIPWRWVQAALLVQLTVIFMVRRAMLSHPTDTENDKLWLRRLLRVFWWLMAAHWLLMLIRYTGLRVIAYLVS